MISWQICHYWSPWVIIKLNIYSYLNIHDIIKDMNEFIKESLFIERKSFINTNTKHLQSIICPHNKRCLGAGGNWRHSI